jgi:hypothetical protein
VLRARVPVGDVLSGGTDLVVEINQAARTTNT